MRNYAAMFRRWLASGSVGLNSVTAYPNGQAPSNYFSMHSAKTMESTLEYHWQTLKRDYERNSGQLFQGYLGPEHIMKAVAMMLNVRISMTEAQELALMIAPEKRGRIQKNDLSLVRLAQNLLTSPINNTPYDYENILSIYILTHPITPLPRL